MTPDDLRCAQPTFTAEGFVLMRCLWPPQAHLSYRQLIDPVTIIPGLIEDHDYLMRVFAVPAEITERNRRPR